MTYTEMAARIEAELNKDGAKHSLHFKVSNEPKADGEWLQFFVESNAERRKNDAAARQIIANVESDLSGALDVELLLVPVHKNEDAA